VSQRVLAERAGVSRTQLGCLERGELKDPSLARVCQVARAAGFKRVAQALPGRGAPPLCEVHLHDIQAVERRIALKQRDDASAGVVILLLADTAHNRRVLSAHREALRPQFPLDGGAILRALRAGRIPSASGILLL
jgi:transcriptional regulator with XRE-family HTH domain